MMYEELRLVKFTCGRDSYENGIELKKGQEYIELRKVHFNDNDVPVSADFHSVSVIGTSKEDLQELRNDLERALSLPVLSDDFRK